MNKKLIIAAMELAPKFNSLVFKTAIDEIVSGKPSGRKDVVFVAELREWEEQGMADVSMYYASTYDKALQFIKDCQNPTRHVYWWYIFEEIVDSSYLETPFTMVGRTMMDKDGNVIHEPPVNPFYEKELLDGLA